MAVSLTKFTPGTVVRVVPNGNTYEDNLVGYVCRTKPENGDSILVGVISAPADSPFATKPGMRLSFNAEHLTPVE